MFHFRLDYIPENIRISYLILYAFKELNVKEYSEVHGVFPSTNSTPHLTENSISLDPT
jgi:hypothetical protein